MKISVIGRVILCSAISVLAGSVAAESGPLIEALRPAEVTNDCSCNFQMPSTKSKYSDATFLQWDTENNGLMRIDGRLIQLKASHIESKMKREMPSIGDTDTFRLRGSRVDVLVNCTTVQVCAAEDDSCESIGYKAKVTVKSPNGTSVLHATGACGC